MPSSLVAQHKTCFNLIRLHRVAGIHSGIAKRKGQSLWVVYRSAMSTQLMSVRGEQVRVGAGIKVKISLPGATATQEYAPEEFNKAYDIIKTPEEALREIV